MGGRGTCPAAGGSGQRTQDGGVALAATAAQRHGGRWRAPRRRSSSRAVSATRAPDMPNGVAQCDGAAVDVDLVLVDAQVVDGGEPDRGERLVDFEEVDGTEGRGRPWPVAFMMARDGWVSSELSGPATMP